MKARRSLQELIQDAGITPVLVRQPCLPAPSQPANIASEEDHTQARNLLVDQRRNNPDYRDPGKQLKYIFRTSKEKGKLQDTERWEFSQEELDQALSAVIDKPATSSGLVQAFLNLGAKVNFIEPEDEKKNKGLKKAGAAARRRSTVLQRAATLRRADSVSLLAGSGADQVALDEALNAALAANDYSCIQELLRHGADCNRFPNALADAVRSNNQNLIRLLLRAPKAFRPEIISSCLPAAVQQKSEPVISLLIGYGADPNFNGASALNMALTAREYRLAIALVAGPIPLTVFSIQGCLEPVLRMPTAQELHHFLQLLFCCGLPPDSPGLSGILLTASKRNDTPLALLMIHYGVSTALNEAECLRNAIANSNWALANAILETPISPAHASAALAVLPADTSKSDRSRFINTLVQKGASGPPLGRWLILAVDEGDSLLTDILVDAGAPLDFGDYRAIYAAVARKDIRTLQKLLSVRPPPSALAKVFPLLRQGYSSSERLETARILLEHGAQGVEIDTALVDAIADTSSSRDLALIEELVRHKADVNYDDGKAISLATRQADIPILQLLLKSKPYSHTTSAALPLTFESTGSRHSTTLQMIDLLLANGKEERPVLQAFQIAVNGGPQNLDIINRLLGTDPRLLGPGFQYVIALQDRQKKIPILGVLLNLGVAQEYLDRALVAEVHQALSQNDTAVLQVLLEHRASVNFNDGEALSIAVASGSDELIRILLGGKEIPSKPSITKAFRSLFHDSVAQGNTRARNRLGIATELLLRGVQQSVIDSALRSVLDPANQDHETEAVIGLLLDYRANVNVADGACFVSAARRRDLNIFAKLLAHEPDFNALVPALIRARLDESVIFKAMQLCLDQGCTSEHLEILNRGPFKTPAMVLVLQEYPRSESLVKLFLDHGCNPDVTTLYVLEPAVGEESVTALVWALAQPQKMVSIPVVVALLNAGASPTRSASKSELSPITLAAREGRSGIIQELIRRGADASVRDKWNRSALFYASRTSLTSIVQTLSAHALKDDGSLHEAVRCLQLEVATILIKSGRHNPNFPCRLHNGRNALGELCLNADVTNGAQRTKLRQLISLLLSNGANPKFKTRNEKSAIFLALDNPHSPLDVTDALLETEVWEDVNDERHMYRDAAGLWYSPIKYVELVPSHSRNRYKQELIELLQDKGCEPKYYSENAEQPIGAVGIPVPIKKLADRQKEHQLSLKLAKEQSEHARMLEESTHRDALRRKQEQQDAEMAAAAAAQAQWTTLESQKHEFEMHRVREAERMKRQEKVAWHTLQVEQERNFAAERLQIEDRKASASFAQEARLIKQRKDEIEYRASVERRMLKEKEELYERNVSRQVAVTERMDESAQLHARLRMERPAIEGAPSWGPD
ncbi:uncharacterized protein BDR25DRAFT_286818 [Lindgomyces ingoldianus]|uniref:Uncharacterized protein n=1 Tax=Lindgomyces ingoldianus TaxID=673940 RepID=A0ACB6QUG5_9PLEO|nr:uncharacterized protein BDR25DRAFT_286818 [Lindgomyces ingoldianus]KAF2470674.1 hypothetical protein BDR25DRAFT_286818 [Lindgomyces ingoldianus]